MRIAPLAAVRSEILALTAEIVAAQVSNNPISGSEVAGSSKATSPSLSSLGRKEPANPVALTPAVPIRRSVTDDYIICLEDGRS